MDPIVLQRGLEPLGKSLIFSGVTDEPPIFEGFQRYRRSLQSRSPNNVRSFSDLPQLYAKRAVLRPGLVIASMYGCNEIGIQGDRRGHHYRAELAMHFLVKQR